MQTQITISGNCIYWKDFCWGEINSQKSTFLLVRRTKRNIFNLFGGGLGINTQVLALLEKLKIQFIVGKLNEKLFKVPVKQWIEKGKKSPFQSELVDPQTILGLDEIFNNDNSFQLSLFGSA